MNSKHYDELLSPIMIGKLRIKNRLVSAPHTTYYVEQDGFINARVNAFYEAIARGGAGMNILGHCPPTPPVAKERPIGIYDDKFIPGLSKLAEIMHKHLCPTFVQLNHPGPDGGQGEDGSRPFSASTIEENELPSPRPVFVPPSGLSISDIKNMQKLFIKAALRAKKANFDGVELHASHTYLLASFFSRIWNRRDDEYGCQSFENRTRIVVEILHQIKQQCGQDFPVGVRINGEEWGAPNAINIEESKSIAIALEKAGADYIHVTGYGFGVVPFRYIPDYWMYPEPTEDMKSFMKRYKQGLFIRAASAIKRVVSIPVLGVGRLTPDLAEKYIANEEIDMAVFGRPLFADPEMPTKLKLGMIEGIAPCTRCATCEFPPSGPRRCRINAALGTIDGYRLKEAAKKKKVMVIGGGPAGMEVARVAAIRGHQVYLYDKEYKLGGLLNIAMFIKGLENENLDDMLRYYYAQFSALNVKTVLKTTVTSSLIKRVKPDVVVLAIGGKYIVPNIPGIHRKNVFSSETLSHKVKLPLKLLGLKLLRLLSYLYLPIGRRVIVIGAALEGLETAEFLVKRLRKVTIVDTSDQLGEGMPTRYLDRLIHWFQSKKVDIIMGIQSYKQITEKGLSIIDKEGVRQIIEADSIVVALPQQFDTAFFESLKKEAPEVYQIGPLKDGKSWTIVDAISSGFQIGRNI